MCQQLVLTVYVYYFKFGKSYKLEKKIRYHTIDFVLTLVK